MRVIISILISILFYQTYAQTTWSERRDWVVGRYEGYYVHGDTITGAWHPITFEIIFNPYNSNYVTLSGFSGGLTFAVCVDSVLGEACDYVTIYDICDFHPPFSGDGGRLFADSTYEHWWYCPPAMCNDIPNWQFFRGKKVESYATAKNTFINSTRVTVFPNPVQDIVTIKRNNLDIEILEIYDLTGKLLLKEKLRYKEENINISILNSGVYVYRVVSSDGILVFGKILKE